MERIVELPDYTVIDVETSIKNRGEDAIGGMKASPFHPDNAIVMAAHKRKGMRGVLKGLSLKSSALSVGQNIKFDLLYMKRFFPDSYSLFIQHGGKIWDTMQVEYLITGQQSKYASLDKLATKYGGHLKDDKIKEYWDNDIDTEDIPEDELWEYLQGDILNTELVFKAQYEKVVQLGMLPLVESQMDAILATTEMEANGMHFDIEKAYELSKELKEELDRYRDSVLRYMTSAGIQEPNPNSIDHMSLLFFGGKQKIIVDKPVLDEEGQIVMYKGGEKKGEVRTKKTADTIPITRKHTPKHEWKLKKPGFYATNDEVLKEIGGQMAEDVLQYRKISKDLNTYFVSFVKQYWPTDKCIHGTFSHCATNTGRLSSSKPNMMNLTGSNK